MLAKVLSSAVLGVDAYVVGVEVDIAMGLPSFHTVGLPDTSVKESRDRVRAAIKNSGFDFPPRRITVNLAPADIRKEGACFDLPMACGILAATGLIPQAGLVPHHLSLPHLALWCGTSARGQAPLRRSAVASLSMPQASGASGRRAPTTPQCPSRDIRVLRQNSLEGH